jgi:hypothetical protein
VNYSALAAEVGCSDTTLHRRNNDQKIAAIAARTEITVSPPVPIPITGPLDGQPWLPHIGTSTSDPNGAVPLAILQIDQGVQAVDRHIGDDEPQK